MCFKVFVVPKIRSFENSFSMILRLEMILLVVSYERKNIIFYEKNLKCTKNNNFNIVFLNIIFPYYHFLQFFKKFIGFS